jgi:hypothetical protein
MMADIISYESKFDNDFDVYVLYPEDGECYTQFKKLIPPSDIAFTVINHKIIMINGEKISELTNEHLEFIECHEISHHLLNHTSSIDCELDEMEADYGAYLILNKFNLSNAAEIVKQYWPERHNYVSFDEFELNNETEIKYKLKMT